VAVTAAVRARIAALAPLAPRDQPQALAGIAAMVATLPGVPQIACYDTAFHAGLPPRERLYALPRARGGRRPDGGAASGSGVQPACPARRPVGGDRCRDDGARRAADGDATGHM